jgi:hypothetical protein
LAAHLKSELNIEPKVVVGERGEFVVKVDDQVVAKKGWIRLPSEKDVVAAVRAAL